MSQEMMDKTCREFAQALAAREPVPGGSASAFVGALGASLCGMVARYGATNPALSDRADDLTRAFAQADELAQELVGLVAEDVRAYGQVSAAYGIPREDPARPAAIQDALHVAAMPPYRIMDACGRALALLEDMADKGSRRGMRRRVLPRRHAGREPDALREHHVYEGSCPRRGARGGVR